MFSPAIRVSTALVLSLSFAACSGGNPSPNPVPSTAPTASANAKNATDTGFVLGAGQSSNGEIGDAQLAISKSSNPDVISFAQLMIKDHTTENQALAPIGTAIGVPAPTGVSSLMQVVTTNLSAYTGSTFDAEYINAEIDGHMMNLQNNYVPELQLGVNTQLTGYATTYQPQVQSHLALAQSIKAKYGF